MNSTNSTNRRNFIKSGVALAATSALLPASFSAENTSGPSFLPGICHLTQEQMAGPYLRGDSIERSNIAENELGIPLIIKFTLIDMVTCSPLENHAVDIWHCNARGRYSGWAYIDPDKPAPSGEISSITRTDESRFLRGFQHTDRHGHVRFMTIYPGFYADRSVHIHIAVKKPKLKNNDLDQFVYIGQVYFPEEINDQVFQQKYYARRAIPRLTNSEDSIFSALRIPFPVMKLKNLNGSEPLDGFYAESVLTVNKDQLSGEITDDDIIKLTMTY